jgi:parvulin-like peptidyl-prolyl isomerase
MSRLLITGAAGVIALVVLILAWGLYDQYVLRPRRPVAIVGGVPIRLETYQKLVTYRRWDYRNYIARLEEEKLQFSSGDEDSSFLLQYVDQQIQQLQSGLLSLPNDALNELIDDQITRQECARRGITVTPEEVELKLEAQFGYDRNPPTPEPTPVTVTLPITVTPTPTTAPMTKEEYQQQSTSWFRLAQDQAGYGEAEFRALLESSLLRQKLAESIGTEVPTTTEQIHARHILVATREEADKALARVKGGEDFAAVAKELSTDDSNKEQGGDLGWFPKGRMVAEFDAAAFALQPGQMSDVVETQNGFHIIRVDERDANRPMDEQDLQQAKSTAVDDWYLSRRSMPDVVRKWDSTMVPKDVS